MIQTLHNGGLKTVTSLLVDVHATTDGFEIGFFGCEPENHRHYKNNIFFASYPNSRKNDKKFFNNFSKNIMPSSYEPVKL